MYKSGIVILVASLAGAAFLILLWLIGLVTTVGGNLIHLLLLLAFPVGILGGILGVVLIIVGKSRARNTAM